MDIQQLLGNTSHQASTSAPSSGSGRAGVFAHHMALASLRPDEASQANAQDDAPRGVFGGITGQPFPSSIEAADELRTGLGAETFLSEAAEGLLNEYLSAEEAERLWAQLIGQLPADQRDVFLAQTIQQLSPLETEQLFARLATQLPADERDALLAQIIQQLSSSETEQLVARLATQLSADDTKALLAEVTAQLSPTESSQLATTLSSTGSDTSLDALLNLSSEQREALIAELSEQRSSEERELIFAELFAQLPAPAQQFLLNGVIGGLTTEERTELFASLGRRQLSAEHLGLVKNTTNLSATTAQPRDLAAVNGQAQSLGANAQLDASQARQTAFSEPLSFQSRLQSEGQPGFGSLHGDSRATISAESSRAASDIGLSTQAKPEPLATSLRELLGLNLVNRNGFVPQQGPGLGSGETNGLGVGIAGGNLSSYGAIGGGQSGSLPAAAQGLTAPLHSSAWTQQLGQQLVILGQRGGDQLVELRLNPPDLGPLTVSLKVGEQGTQIQFLAANALVRGVVEQALPQLREALAEQGINLGETSVGEQRQEGEQGFAESDARQQTTSSDILTGTEEGTLGDTHARTETWIDGTGRVDLYA